MHPRKKTTRTRLHPLALLLLIGAAVPSAACSITADEEQDIGDVEAEQIEAQLPILRDTTIDQYITALGLTLATGTERAAGPWRFAVVNTAQVNAFSLPGGYIYINRGLIEEAGQLDELAGVMGHEIAHVVRRHSVRQLEESARRDLGVVLLCTLTDACSTIGGRIVVRAGADALTARYSQDDELEADAEAVQYTVRAGYDPDGLAVFLRRMLEQRERNPTLVESLFATHPPDDARIRAITRQIEGLGDRRARGPVRDTAEFHVIQARIREMPTPPESSQ